LPEDHLIQAETCSHRVEVTIHSFIHSLIPLAFANATIPCRSQELLQFLSVIYIFPPLFFHPPTLHLAIYFLVFLTIFFFFFFFANLYNTLLEILFSSIIFKYQYQRNTCNLIIAISVGFLTIDLISLFVSIHKFSFYCHFLSLKFFLTFSFQKPSFSFYLSLLVSMCLMLMLTFCRLLCSLVLTLYFLDMFLFLKLYVPQSMYC
jgi:hypothetical protein